MREKHIPKELPVSRRLRKRIIESFRKLPLVEPEITICEYNGEPFDVDVCGFPNAFVPLTIGAEGFYAEYACNGGSLLEVNLVRVIRRIKVYGIWCYEFYENGSSLDYGRFYYGYYDRIGYWGWEDRSFGVVRPDYIQGLGRYTGVLGSKEPRVISATNGIKWVNPQSVEGSYTDGRHFVCYNTVIIDGREYCCMRALYLDEENGVIDDEYFNRDGRPVFMRRYLSHDDDLDALKLAQERRNPVLIYNGKEYLASFDTLTDVSFPDILQPK